MGRPYRGVSEADRVAARRARLLDAGLELYGTRGFDATGVREICREAGLTDRYFYESFRDGRGLFTAVFDQVTDDLFRAVAVAVGEAGPGAEAQLRAAIGAFVHALADDPRRRRVVFSESGGAGPEVERHMRGTLRRFTALVAATARQHLGDETPDELIQVLAMALVGTLERVVIEWQDGELDMPVERIVDLCTELFAAFFAGAAARGRRPGARG